MTEHRNNGHQVNGHTPAALSACSTPPAAAIVGVVSVDVEDLEWLPGIPAGVAVCVELGDQRWVDLRVLDLMALKTWGVRAVTVRGRHPETVRDTVSYLQRAHHEHAAYEARLAADAAAAEDRWWNGVDEVDEAGGVAGG
jgi:hypothetical protein